MQEQRDLVEKAEKLLVWVTEETERVVQEGGLEGGCEGEVAACQVRLGSTSLAKTANTGGVCDMTGDR